MLRHNEQRNTTAWARLILLAERDPRRGGMIALAWMQQQRHSAYVLLAIGWALLRWERLAEAEAALVAAVAGLPPADHATQLRGARALLMVTQLRGAGAELQAQWEAHVARCVAVGETPALLSARCEQLAHLNLLGRFTAARALAELIAPQFDPTTDPALRARFVHVWGVAAIGCGDLPTAQRLLAQAHTLFAQTGRRAEVARVAFEQGWLGIRSEQLDAAQQALQRARRIYQRLGLPFRVALCERDFGTVAYLQGDYGPAIRWAVAAREQFVALGYPTHAASCDFNLGTVAHLSGLYDLALAVYQRAEQSYHAQGNGFAAFIAGRNQVLAYCAQGDPAQALLCADRLTAQVAALGDELGACELLAARAHALRDLGRLDAAAHAWHSAAERFAALGNPGAAAECRLELAWLKLQAGAFAPATTLLHALDHALADRPAQRWRVQYGLGQLAAHAGDLDAAQRTYTTAVRMVASIRRQFASEHASSGIFQQAQELHHAALELAAQREDHAALIALAASQQSLSLEQQRMQAGLHVAPPHAAQRMAASTALRQALRNPRGAAERDAALNTYLTTLLHTRQHPPNAPLPIEQLDLPTLRQRVTASYGNHWSLLCPLFSADTLFVLGLTPEASFCTRQPITPHLRHLLDRACLPSQRQITYRDLEWLRDPTRTPWHVLSELGQVLLPDWLRQRLAPAHRLLIVPSGPLHSLAWAALRIGDRWLCEQAIIHFLPSLRVRQRPPQIDPHAAALLIGCSDFGSRAAPLPLVGPLLDRVAQLWPGPSSQLRDAAATVAALRDANANQQLRHYGLIQIASHAQLGAPDGLLAQLQLADDALLLDEVAQLHMQAALVILTACEGGAGTALPGDEVLSLSRALLAAGAQTVLASQWTIYDQGVLALVEPLYQALAAGHDAATALAYVQRALCTQPPVPGSILDTPYLWGGWYVLEADG